MRRGAFYTLEEKNESLEERIEIRNESAFRHLRRIPHSPYDILSLDFCGPYTWIHESTFAHIFAKSWLAPNGMLITNFLKGREDAQWQTYLKKMMPTLLQLRQKAGLRMEQVSTLARDELEHIQEAPSEYLNSLFDMQASGKIPLGNWRDFIIQHFILSTAYQGRSFDQWDTFPLWCSVLGDGWKGLLDEEIQRQGLVGPVTRRMMLAHITPEPLADPAFTLQIMQSSKGQYCVDHRAYAYVSDAGHAMISDCFAFEQIPLHLNPSLTSSFSFDAQHGQPKYKLHDRRKYLEMTRKLDRAIKDSYEAFLRTLNRLPLKREVLCAAEPEGIAEVTEIPSNGESHRSVFTPSDLEVIIGFIREGDSAPDIAYALDGEYTWQKIAALKATITRGNAVNLFNVWKPVILKRDEYHCQYPECDTTQEDNRRKSGHNLHVHHIDYNHENHTPRNMITLCTSCHAKTNTIQHGAAMREVLEARIAHIYAPKSPMATP